MSYPVIGSEQENIKQTSSTSQFDLKKLIFKLISILPWVVICLAITIFSANLYLRYTPKLYTVKGRMLIKDEDQSNYQSLKELGIVAGNLDVENQMEILASFTLSERVVDSLNLNIKIKQDGRVTSSEMYGVKQPFSVNVVSEDSVQKFSSYHIDLMQENFYISGIGGKRKFTYGDTLEVEYGKIIIERNRLVKANSNGYQLIFNARNGEASELASKITVTRVTEQGGIIQLAMLDEIPERGVNVLNTLMQVYNRAGLDDKNIVANKTIKFLTEKLDKIIHDLDSLEIMAERFQIANKVPSFQEAGSVFFSEYTALGKDKDMLLIKGKMLDFLESYITNFRNTNDLIPPSFQQTDPILLSSIENHNKTVLEKQKLEIVSTKNDAHLLDMVESIKAIRQNILRIIRNVKIANQAQLEGYEASSSLLETKLQSIPSKKELKYA
jgi:hypothetical protein